ncbi:MAG: hypothetical protein M1825_004710 [Sarcosagium campestre]|nr:MAG: hypothetical protein M1825_004710 [Sarcosagium campestre]
MALSILYAPQIATTSPAVDIVAVHGLGGDAIDTWTHPKSKAFWLKDFLPKQIPDARVMTFGYNAAAAFEQSTAEVIDHAKSLLTSLVDKREESEEVHRPLIFVAHSLGGIVVKQALLQAKLEPRYQSIKDATLGIIFFGTPHRGSDKATYGKVLATVAQFMSHRPPPRLVAALQTNSDVLLRLTSDFRFQLPDYQVYSFFELRPMKGHSTLIVEKHSALLETNHEEQIPVDADHSAMCKFETEADDTFEKVYKRVKRMKNTPRSVANEQSVSNNKHFEVPYLLSPVFTGRDDVLERLTTSFTAKRSAQNRHQQRFVLFGLGGSGKTQICLRYIQEHRERYWAIFWVDASSDNRVQQCFTQMARLLQVDEEVDSVKRKLANTSQTWLLIFDNADNPNLKLAPYFPAGDRGDIVIASRNPQHQHYSTVGSQEVTRLSLHDSTLLLTKVVYGEIDISPRASEERKTIVEIFGGHALAIVQAGAYIRETSCSLPDYLELYQRRKKDLLEYLPTHLGTDYQHSVYATWQVSVDMIESMRDTVSHSALRLLSLLGFYHHDQVPVQMFYHAWQNLQANQDLPDYLPWRDAVSDFFDYRQVVQASITLLGSFSLVTRNAEFSLSLHPLVHDWCRERMSVEEQQSNYRRALYLLTSSVTWKFQSDDYTRRPLLVSHVHELLRLLAPYGYLSEEDKMRQWPLLAEILMKHGWMEDALPLAAEVLTLQKSKLGEDHPDTLVSMHSLAFHYSLGGRQSEALPLAEEVVILRKSKLGEDHPDTLDSMHSLAFQYSLAGRRSEALRLAEEMVILRKSKLGEDHPDTAGSTQSRAYILEKIAEASP